MKADATAEAITKVAKALNQEGGEQAANLEVAKQYVSEFGNLAKENNTLIIPSDVNNLSSMVATAMSVIEKTKKLIPIFLSIMQNFYRYCWKVWLPLQQKNK